ncbi:ABC transporter permease [Paenibacillus sp. HN-1]|uniref:ABC transporter permease n=1 Tax=Paenibacillus TaxID=44249 RepID=UPI001CA8D843|nr:MULTISPECIES: ABC transporter permease [Paenibacillus]MBY9080501.1 ABC transporter permease [Paenibacillus sp. CGMCC 1.18879]MBY9085554.1 ABC transporter permease [Paenibacillus sinensis]
MIEEVIQEVKRKVTPLFLFLWILTTAAVISLATFRSQNYILRDSLEFFTFTINTVLPIVFPILAVLVYTVSFSEEVQNRHLTYTRMRRPIMETLYIKLNANILLTGVFFFLLVFISFLFAYYIEPSLDIAQYKPERFGLTKENIAADTYSRYTFTQLLRYGSITYGILYSLWVGMNAALYSVFGFLLVLFMKNRFLAVSFPFIVYLVVSFTLAALGLEKYRPNNAIFPFDRIQSSIWTAFVPFLILASINVCLVIYVKRNISKVESLT